MDELPELIISIFIFPFPSLLLLFLLAPGSRPMQKAAGSRTSIKDKIDTPSPSARQQQSGAGSGRATVVFHPPTIAPTRRRLSMVANSCFYRNVPATDEIFILFRAGQCRLHPAGHGFLDWYDHYTRTPGRRGRPAMERLDKASPGTVLQRADACTPKVVSPPTAEGLSTLRQVDLLPKKQAITIPPQGTEGWPSHPSTAGRPKPDCSRWKILEWSCVTQSF